MQRAAAVSLMMVALVLGACTSTRSTVSSSISLVNDAAAACARLVTPASPAVAVDRDRQLCSYYFDLRIWDSIQRHLADALAPDLAITPVPCLVDGPGCLWRERYDQRVRAGFETAFGDPSPQPSTPLPFSVMPARLQLERAVVLREGLALAVADLDQQIEALRATAGQ